MICSVISKHCLARQRVGLLQPPGLLAGSDFTPPDCAPGVPMRTRDRYCTTEINRNRARPTSSSDQGLGNVKKALLALLFPENIPRTGKGKCLHEHDHSCGLVASVSRSQTVAIKNRSAWPFSPVVFNFVWIVFPDSGNQLYFFPYVNSIKFGRMMLATQLSSCVCGVVMCYVHLQITECQPKSGLCHANSKKQTLSCRVYNQYMRESAFTIL